MKKTLLLLFLIFFYGCKEKHTELTINNSQTTESEHITSKTKNTASRRELIEIKKEDTLKILIRSDFAPWSYISEDKKLVGYHAELIQSLMGRMGQKFKFIPYNDTGKVIQGFKTGEYHAAVVVSHSPDYLALANMSIIYDTLNYVTFIRTKDKKNYKDQSRDIIKQFSGKKIGAEARGNIYQSLRDYKNIKLVEYPTTTEALRALNRGDVDAVPAIKDVGNYYNKLNNWSLTNLNSVIFSYNISTGFSRALDKSIIERYNQALSEAIEEDFIEYLRIKYLKN